jgi:thymidylate synthase
MIADKIVTGKTTSDAWAAAFDVLADAKGRRLFHFAVRIEHADEEVRSVREIADRFMKNQELERDPTIVTVRNTIFPKTLVRLASGPEDLPRVYEVGQPHRRRYASNSKGRYFERMILGRGGAKGVGINQIAETVRKLRDRPIGKARYEVDLGLGDDDSVAIGVYQAERDITKPVRSAFPCMSHLSFQRDGDVVHVLAYYRSQDVATKAYGNYLGIGQLGAYVARQSDLVLGTVTVVAGIAELNPSPAGLVKSVRSELASLRAVT